MSSKQEFLEAKAENFKKYVYQYSPSQEIQEFVAGFSKEQLIPTIATKIVPLLSMNLVDSTADQLLAELTVPDNKKEEVKNKIIAYITMFAKVLLEA